MPKRKPSLWDINIGLRLRKLRFKRGLALQDLANELNWSWQMVQKVEKGLSRLSAEEAVTLAAFLKADIRKLLDVKPLRSQSKTRT